MDEYLAKLSSDSYNWCISLLNSMPWLTWENISLFGNSAFTTSLIGALAGAFAGAVAAQRIAERGKLRDELKREIRNTNAGIIVAFDVLNSVGALKRQHVRALKEAYDAELLRHAKFVNDVTTGRVQSNGAYELFLDFRQMPLLSPPVAALQEIAFGRLSITGRALSLTASVAEHIQNLNSSLQRRNELISMYRDGKFPAGAEVEMLYLGIPYGGGHVNREYGDSIDAIASYTNDAIFCAYLLCADLRKHGIELATSYGKQFKDAPPPVNNVDFQQAREDGTIPQDEKYPMWFTAYKSHPQKIRKWWQVGKMTT